MRPYLRTKDGARSTWTGYRLTFPEPIDLHISGNDDNRRRVIIRLSKRFTESEIEADGIFCTRSALAEDSSRIVADVEYLLSAAKELQQPVVTVDHPQPPPSVATVELPAPKAPATPDPSPPPLPLREKPEVPVENHPEAEVVSEPTVETEEPTPEVEPEPEKALPLAPPASALAVAARDLFDTGRNRFETGRHFSAEFQGRTLEGSGILRRVDRFSNDRVFGRGPGLIAEVEIWQLENPAAGLHQVTAMVQLPSEEEEGMSVQHWREHLGELVAVCGTAIRCDAFTGKLFLADGLVDSPLASKLINA